MKLLTNASYGGGLVKSFPDPAGPFLMQFLLFYFKYFSLGFHCVTKTVTIRGMVVSVINH